MSKAKRDYHVFLSYSLSDRPTAEKVAQAMKNAGLSVFTAIDLPGGCAISEEINRVLAASDALVLILPSEGTIDANAGIELGAAMAWKKPICLVRPENGHVRMPGYLSSYPTYPISRIDDVVRLVKEGLAALSAKQLEVLREVYVSMGIPTDKFRFDPAMLDELAHRFKTQTGSHTSGERLLYEMMRLRKRGKWPRLTRTRKETR
jgi:hypothetical protein